MTLIHLDQSLTNKPLQSPGSGRSRTLHRSLVCRRVLLELAGGKSGTKLFLGRICFIVSGAAMWLALHVLLLIDDDTTVLMFLASKRTETLRCHALSKIISLFTKKPLKLCQK